MTKVRVKSIAEAQKPIAGHTPGEPLPPPDYVYQFAVETLGTLLPGGSRFTIESDDPAAYQFGIEYDLELIAPGA